MVGRGVDTERFAPARRSAALRREWQAESAPVLLMVGRVAAEKNVELGLRAFEGARRPAPDLRLVVVGDGPARSRLQSAHPDARFVGVQRGAELAAHYASADLFLFPSLSDTFGNVVLEALASGLPVASFAVAAAAEHVVDGLSRPAGRPGRRGRLPRRRRIAHGAREPAPIDARRGAGRRAPRHLARGARALRGAPGRHRPCTRNAAVPHTRRGLTSS